ncbi:MAG: DUF4864 domain-containing protein [Verrucomicrobiales bacterium]|nr:DUF4864 domain-containing protein [Verrucomicrobiales bacterium]
MSFCKNCGAELSETDEFCAKCGHETHEEVKTTAEVESSPPAANEENETKTVSTPSKRKLSGCAIAAIAGGAFVVLMSALGVLVLIFAFAATSPAVDAVDAHLEALKLGQIEIAYDGTAGDFQKSTPIDSYRSFVASYPILGDVVDSSFSDREVENGIATIKGTIEDSAGNKEELHARLIKVGDEWKILGLNLPNVISSQVPGDGSSSVGEIVIGAGRNPDGSLINPGSPLPAQTPMLSANVELINHPDGETVEVYIRQGESRTASITATNLAEGSSFMPADIDISEANFPPGEYEFVVMLAGQAQFAKAFEIR